GGRRHRTRPAPRAGRHGEGHAASRASRVWAHRPLGHPQPLRAHAVDGPQGRRAPRTEVRLRHRRHRKPCLPEKAGDDEGPDDGRRRFRRTPGSNPHLPADDDPDGPGRRGDRHAGRLPRTGRRLLRGGVGVPDPRHDLIDRTDHDGGGRTRRRIHCGVADLRDVRAHRSTEVRRHSGGFSMVETMVAIALLGVIVVSVVSAFSTVSLATQRYGVTTNLDRLTRSEAEFIKSQTYIRKGGAPYRNLAAPGYAFAVQILYYNPVNQTFTAANNDVGLQEIVLTVTATARGTEILRF